METMTYFSGFHSQRGPRLFHSRFLAAPRPSVPSAVAARGSTHGRTRILPCLGCNIATFLHLLRSFVRSFPSFTVARHFSSLSLSFHVSLNRSTAPLPFRFFFQVIRSRRSDRSSFARGNPRVSILELRNGKYIDAYRGFPSRSKYRSETAFGSIYGSVRWKISGTFSPSE